MGMYTELVLATRVKKDSEAVPVLFYMAGRGEKPTSLPDHPLFQTSRWPLLLSCSSYYFVPRSTCLLEFDDIGDYWVIISRSDLKNYDNEIEKFIDWLRPHLEDAADRMIGYSRYEESREPIIYYG